MSVSIKASQLAQSDVRCACGGNHLPQDHWEFLESMSQSPTDLIELV